MFRRLGGGAWVIGPGLAWVLSASLGSSQSSVPDLVIRYAQGERTLSAPDRMVPGSLLRELDRAASRLDQNPLPLTRELARRAVLAFALEAGAWALFSGDAPGALELAEWACARVRQRSVVDGFDVRWHLAALSLIEAAIDPAALERHLNHIGPSWEHPRKRLARALMAEQQLAPTRARPPSREFGGSVTGLGNPAIVQAEHDRLAQAAIEEFLPLRTDKDIGADATLRLARLYLDQRNVDWADTLLAAIDGDTRDPALIYLARLFRGQTLEALGRPAAAETAYRDALRIGPRAHAAAMSLAAFLFRTNRRPEADVLVQDLLTDPRSGADPWWLYWSGDARFWNARITDLRDEVRDPGHATKVLFQISATPAETFRQHVGDAVNNGADAQTFRTTTDAVAVSVSVRDGSTPVSGLRAEDFRLSDNGVAQQIRSVARESLPIDVTFLVDASSSVAGALLERLKTAVRDAVTVLQPQDRVRLLSVHHNIREVFRFQSSHDLSALNHLRADGATSLYDALVAGMVRATPADRRHVVIAYTDGRDTMSVLPRNVALSVAGMTEAVVHLVVPSTSGSMSEAEYDAHRLLLFGARAPLPDALTSSPVLPPARLGALPDEAMLRAVTETTGGRLLEVEAGRSLTSAFRSALDDFRHSYVLYYTPSGVPLQGWHALNVRVARAGSLSVRARSGYAISPSLEKR